MNEDGSISTFNDLYGHDARMAAALKLGGAMPPPEPVAFNSETRSQAQAEAQPGIAGARRATVGLRPELGLVHRIFALKARKSPISGASRRVSVNEFAFFFTYFSEYCHFAPGLTKPPARRKPEGVLRPGTLTRHWS